jgi:hypothetical protein
MDEHFVHQIPELLPSVVSRNPFWRESYFVEVHDPSGDTSADIVALPMAHYPATMATRHAAHITELRATEVL